jgi:hypothetical protein
MPHEQHHHRLHCHALESVFKHLTLGELRSCALVSCNWRKVVYTMRGISSGRTLYVITREHVRNILKSSMARHIHSLDMLSFLPSVCVNLLRSICCHMPFLRSLAFKLESIDDWQSFTTFPSTLTCVNVAFTRDCIRTTEAVQDILDILSRHRPLTNLKMEHVPVEVSLAPLQALDNLTSLSIEQPYQEWPDRQLQELRSLTQVKHIDLWLTEDQLLYLLRAPCNRLLQWTQLSIHMGIDDACAALLPTVCPGLESVCISAAGASPNFHSLAFLTQLPQLTHLHFSAKISVMRFSQSRLDRLLLTLPVSLPLVTSLHLDGGELTSILQRFPHLETLALENVWNWNILYFLNPVCKSLRTLSMIFCERGSLTRNTSTLLWLKCMPQLTSLSLHDTYILGELERCALQPPSSLLPSLVQFNYSSRRQRLC